MCGRLFPAVECKGVPLRIREFCKWLKDTSRVMVDGDGVARLHGSTKVADFKPPSRQSILRANVNQLPPRHTMLLKCASILGHRFECHLLQSLLPERAQRLGSLKTDLEELAAAGLVEQMDICDEDLWQVISMSQRLRPPAHLPFRRASCCPFSVARRSSASPSTGRLCTA